MNLFGRRVATLLVLSLVLLSGLGTAEAGVNAFWKPLGGSASGGGISNLGANVSAESARLAFGPDNLPVVVYGTEPVGVTGNAQIAVRRWTGTAWQDLSPAPAVFGAEPRIAIAANGTRYISWLQDDGLGPQVHLLQRTTSGTSWTALGLMNSSAVTALNTSVFTHALAVGSDNLPVVAIDTLAQTNLFPFDEGVLQGTHQIYVLTFDGLAWQYLGGDPTTGGASNASSLLVDGTNYATHEAFNPSLAVVNGRPTVAFVYSTSYASGSGSPPIEFIPGNTEIFVTQFNANASAWMAVGPPVPQSDDGGAARGGLGGASNLPGGSLNPSIAGRGGASPILGLTWQEADPLPAIYARVFDGSNWVPFGTGSDVLNDPLFENFDPQMAIGPDGRAVVAWGGFDGTTEQIFVKRSGPAGFEEMGPDSAEGPGISDAPFFALRPSIAAPATGGPAVAWLTNPAGDQGYQVYLRQFSAATSFQLTVNRTGAGANTSSVSSSEFGFDCPSDSCSELFPSGQTVQLTASAGAHAKFNTWTGCTSVSGAVCNVLMNANKTVTANFVAVSTVVVTRLGNGAVSIGSTPAGINCGPGAATDCSETYTAGTAVTLNASVPTGTVFGGWGGDCAFRNMNLSCPLAINGTDDRTVTVFSTLKQYALGLRAVTKAGPTASGTIDGMTPDLDCVVGQPTCTQLVDHGTQVRIQSVPGSDSRFIDYLTVPATGICSNLLNASCQFSITGNTTVTAEFRQVTLVSVNKFGNGATRAGNKVTFAGDGFPGSGIDCGLDCTGEAFTNQSVVFTATLATGTNLDPDGGVCTWTGTGTTRTCSFVASGLSQSIDANFVQQKRHLHVLGVINGIQAPGTNVFTTSNPPGIDCGNVHPFCDADFDFGTTVALTPFGDANTDFDHWTGCSRLNGSVCLVDMTANVTTTKFFNAVRTLSITGTGNGNGQFLIAGTPTFSYLGTNTSVARRIFTGGPANASITKTLVTPVAATGSTFAWQSSDFGCTGSAACTATMNNNHSAVGRFLLNRHVVTVQRRANGSVTSVFPPGTFDCGSDVASTDCTETFDFGTPVHLLATPDDGFIFDRWQGVTCVGGQTNTSCGFKVTGNSSIIPFFRAHTFVNVAKTGNGKGTLAATIAAGGTLKPTAPTCGESCSALNFDAFDNRLVTLRATESVGSRFDGFAGECVSNTSVCTYLPSGNNDSVLATFTLRQFVTSVFNNPNGSVVSTNLIGDVVNCGAGNFDCDTTQNFGQPVTLVATPSDGFTFTGWVTSPSTLCTNPGGNANSSCSFKVPAGNTSARANFRLRTLVSLTRTGNGTGTVTSTPAGITCGADCSEAFFDGKPVSLLASPAVGSSFGGFGGITCSSNSSSCSFVPSGSVQNISATFTLKQFVTSVFNNPNGSVVSTNLIGDVVDCGAGNVDCDTTQNFNQLVNLHATPLDGYVFTNWTTVGVNCNNVLNSTNRSCSFRVPNGNTSVRANFRLRTLVTVLRNGTGTGTVTSTPAGITCGTDCSEAFFDGKPVTLNAVAGTGSSFVSFSGACTSNTSSCTFIPSGDNQSVVATFNKQAVNLRLAVTGDGFMTRGLDVCDSGDVCNYPGLFGDSVTLIAHPNATNRLVSFTGCTTSNSSACTVLLNGSKNVSAVFSFSVSVSKFGDGTGTVTPTAGTSCGTGCTNYAPGTVVTLTETPGAGSAFGGWDDDCAFRGFNTSCALTANQNHVVSAGFFKPVLLLVSKIGGGNGSVTSSPAGITCGSDCSNLYPFNTVVTLTAAAASGSVFGGFTGCDSTGIPTNLSCRLTMLGNRTVVATFTPPVATLTVQTPSNGTITGPGVNCGTGGSDCSETYGSGTVVTLNAAPDTGFFFQGWGGACATFGTSSNCSLTMSTSRTVSATFAPLTIITILFDGNGTGAVDVTGAAPCTDTCTRFVEPGTPVFLTPNPAPGSVFGEWGGPDCAGTPRNESCSFFTPGFGNFSGTVSFLANPVSVSILGDSQVRITSEYSAGTTHGTPFIASKDCDSPCDLLVESGTQVTFTATAAPGKIFNTWLIDCASFGSSDFCFLDINANGSVVATSSTNNQSALTIFFDGDASGTVDISPDSITCQPAVGGGPCVTLLTPGSGRSLQGQPAVTGDRKSVV